MHSLADYGAPSAAARCNRSSRGGRQTCLGSQKGGEDSGLLVALLPNGHSVSTARAL